MNSESTDQVQGQESASIQDTTSLQNQLLDTSNIQLQNSAVNKITQNCTSDEVETVTSSIQISDSQESSDTKYSNEAHKSLITNLYKVLVCEKLPATDESSSLSVITNKIFLTPDIKENETFNQRIEEFIEILEVLSEPCGCDKIGSNNCAKIEEMTKNVRFRIEKIKVDKSRLALLIKEDKLERIAEKYENLKADEVLMKVLFHKSYSIGNLDNKIFKKLKNYQSNNQEFILKDLCDTFERIVIPKGLEQKFNKVSYKLIPFTSTEIRNFHHNTENSLDHDQLLKFCEYIDLRVKVLTKVGKIFVMENILLFELIVQAFVDLKIELDNKVYVFSILDNIYKKQLQANPQQLTENDKIMQLKFLQVHALKSMFRDELTKSLEAVQTFEASQPPITSLNGIFSVNFNDNSIDFHCKIVAEYFVTKFIMDNIFTARTKDITAKESKIIVKILALIIPNNQRLLNQINDAIQQQYKNPSSANKVQESIFKVIRKAQYWSIATDVFNRPLKFINTLDNGKIFIISDWEFWERFYTNIGYQDEKDEAKTAMQSVEKKPKKKSKEVVDRPTVKGVTSSKKLSYNHDISSQFDDFSEDF